MTKKISISDIKDLLGVLGLFIFCIIIFLYIKFKKFNKNVLERNFILFFITAFCIDFFSVMSIFTKYNVYDKIYTL